MFVPYIAIGAGILALLYGFGRSAWIEKQDTGTDRMRAIGAHIAEGAMAFLKAEYKVLVVFVAAAGALLAVSGHMEKDSAAFVGLSFAVGAGCSALAGYLGMRVATKSNYRTAAGARTSLEKALTVAFAGGSVMGLGVVGLGVIGISVLFLLYNAIYGFGGAATDKIMNIISGFSLGASSIALFARVGGGIYTKAADVGADLVGKVEAGIPEDHPLNPATIADNVGDNVGDVAGMGADLFESYVGSIISAMILGSYFIGSLSEQDAFGGTSASLLPLAIAALGIGCSIIGTFFVRVREGGDPQKALNRGYFVSSGIMIALSFLLIKYMLPASWSAAEALSSEPRSFTANGVFFALVIGLVGGVLVGIITEYYTGSGRGPVNRIVQQSATGAATNIISGLSTGMMSTALPTLVIAASIMGSFHYAGLYGIAVAGLGMLANTGIQLAVDAYGPIADNAGGIAEMSQLPKEVRERTDKLDAVGNTTAAIGKGFAIASAALTALALFAAYMSQVKLTVINVADANVMAGLFVGAMFPFVFSALAMSAVGEAAMNMVKEVRRQFTEIPELKAALAVLQKYGHDLDKLKPKERRIVDAADGKAEYAKCVAISTDAALKKMILPGLLAVLTPVVAGYVFGPAALGGLLAGCTVTGVLMAIFQSNAGGAWDNAKKSFEGGVMIDGKEYRKGSDPHKAAVVGDTVGDPLKDTSGPSLNILIKLMSVVSLVIAPLIRA